MAVGVPETEVFAAADAVLERGERPTVERVRQELGRGSPARVGALLDQWGNAWLSACVAKHACQRCRRRSRRPLSQSGNRPCSWRRALPSRRWPNTAP